MMSSGVQAVDSTTRFASGLHSRTPLDQGPLSLGQWRWQVGRLCLMAQ